MRDLNNSSTRIHLERAIADWLREVELSIKRFQLPSGVAPALVLAGAVSAAMVRFDLEMTMAQALPHRCPLPDLTRMQAEAHSREYALRSMQKIGWT